MATTSGSRESLSDALASRLVKRLSQLSDTSSKESLQALAKYIGYRRKHAKSFSAALSREIESATSVRQGLILQIVHESIILDSGSSRWDRMSEMREALGEFCVLQVATKGCLDADTTKKVEVMVKLWDTLNAFGGPTLITLIKKQLATPAIAADTQGNGDAITNDMEQPLVATTTVPAISVRPKSPVPRSPKRTRSPSPKPKEKKQGTTSSTTSNKKQEVPPSKTKKVEDKGRGTDPSPTAKTSTKSESFVYDFESKNIPYGKVEAKDFLAPCKAIATLQIARDLRNDAAVQLSSLLTGLPEEVVALCEEADKHVKETGKAFDVPDDKARELSMKTNERLLDLDLEEQLQNIRTFREILEKQRAARQSLIRLLIQSRCRFGAQEAAEAFYKLEDTMAELQKRKETLLDAMALEGLDFEDETGADSTKKKDDKQNSFPPLEWYFIEKQNSENKISADEPSAKRAKAD